MNDWLLKEFKNRTTKKRQIILTKRLTEALELSSVKVTSSEKKVEEELLIKKLDDLI